MKYKMIILIISLVILLSLVGCENYSIEEKELIDFIKSFYSVQYEAYSNFEYFDIEPYLDMNKIQNQNKIIALKRLIIEHKHMENMKYCYIDRNINPINFQIKKINVNGNFASINLEIELEKGRYYPEFISGGENNFVLKRIDNSWKIINHDYEGMIYFEKSYTKLLTDVDEEKIKRIIDNEFGESPLSI